MCKAMEDLIREERAEAAREATEQALLQSVKSAMKNLNLTLDQACVALGVPPDEMVAAGDVVVMKETRHQKINAAVP